MNWQEQDKAYVWHPFTPAQSSIQPVHIERAEGVYLYSSDGRSIIDAVSSWWVNIHGHSHPHIAKAVAEQAATLEHVIFAGFTHTPAIKLAAQLVNIVPGNMAKVFYSDNGSTAVEVALKMALQYWYNKGIRNKTTIIAFEDAYHGDTFGAMSVGGRSPFNAPFDPLLFDVVHIPAPSENNLEQLKEQLETLAAKGNVAAFLYEPLVQGSGGMLMHKAEHLNTLLQLMRRHGIICIADEVMTGFGRTGTFFASEQMQEKPDIICLSKGITGGFLPLGVTMCNAGIFSAFDSDERLKTFFHGHSYTANPITCAAALASMELLLEPACMANIRRIGKSHTEFMSETGSRPLVGNIRQTGTLLAFDIVTKEQSSYFNSIRDDIYNYCLEYNVLLRPLGNTVYIMPPYCMTDETLQKVYTVIENLLSFLEKRYL